MSALTTSSFDVAIIGLGVMGSAALAALARRGRRVVGIDRYAAGHDRGSSHGASRIIRLGYFEHPSYVPLLRAAYPLWRELEARSGQSLLSVTGILEIGAPTSDLVGVFQPDGGFVRAEPTVAALQVLARKAGAQLRMEERVLAVEQYRDG